MPTKRVTAPRKGVSVRRKKSRKYAMARPISTKAMQRRGLGNVLYGTLHYADTDTLNPGVAGITSEQKFRLSSIFDPDSTGGGHQPNMHDSLAVLWERYQVYRVDFHIEMVSIDSTNPQRVGYRISDESTSITDPLDSIENGNGEWKHISPTTGGRDCATFTGTVSLCNVHGITSAQYMANDDYGADFGSNPLENAYLIVWADGLLTDTSGVRVTTHIVYHTKLMGAKFVNQS